MLQQLWKIIPISTTTTLTVVPGLCIQKAKIKLFQQLLRTFFDFGIFWFEQIPLNNSEDIFLQCWLDWALFWELLVFIPNFLRRPQFWTPPIDYQLIVNWPPSRGRWLSIDIQFEAQVRAYTVVAMQHRPKAGKKKKTREAGLFFLVPASTRCSIRKGVNPALPIVVLTHPIKFFSISSGVQEKTLSSDLEQSNALEAFQNSILFHMYTSNS